MPIAGMLELVDWGWYDSVGIPRPSPDAEMPPVELFRHPIGIMDRHPVSGRSEVKSETETNMIEPGMLPSSHEFVVKAIRAAFIDVSGDLMSIATASRFYRAAVLRLWINSKLYGELPLFKFADPAVMFGDPRTFLDILKDLSSGERAEFVRALRKQLEPELYIARQQPFRVELRCDQAVKWDGPTAPAGVIVLLEGVNARAVL